jgi:hydroxyquinol 1,2-dioxygenase
VRNIDEHNITTAVIARFANCTDPRLKAVLTSLVTHLHDFVRETRLTEAEWMEGIRFLTDTGHTCDGQRQEFILLSDTLGVSMLTVALNQSRPPGATEATVFGPFHVDDAPVLPDGADLARGAPGEALFVEVEVVGLDGTPVADAQVEVWQADEEGLYDVQRTELGDERRARGVLRTDATGGVRFRTIVPTAYPVPTDGPVGRMLVASGRHPWRPAHIHFRIQAPGWRTLITHLFRNPDPYLDSDVVFGVRSSLIADYVHHERGPLLDAPYSTLKHRFVLTQDTVAA